jgi:hypothetical protein
MFSVVAHSTEKKIIGAVGFNANDFSTLLPTMRKSALISVNARFSALLPTLWTTAQKKIGVVAYTAEKLLVLLIITQKNV